MRGIRNAPRIEHLAGSGHRLLRVIAMIVGDFAPAEETPNMSCEGRAHMQQVQFRVGVENKTACHMLNCVDCVD